MDQWKELIMIEESWDSKRIIGSVEERFDQLKRKNFDWSSFYNGWVEGRFAMLVELSRDGVGKKEDLVK